MALTDFLLRIRTYTGWVTKGSELDMEELDDNLIELIQQFQALKNLTAIPVYDAAWAYQPAPPTTYVSYGTNDVLTYKFVSATAKTGVTPGTDPSVWQLVSFSQEVGNTRQGVVAVTTAGTIITFTSPLGTLASDYVLNFWCYNINGDTVICSITNRTSNGFTVTPAEDGNFEYFAKLV